MVLSLSLCSSGDHIPKTRWSSLPLLVFGESVMPSGKHKLMVSDFLLSDDDDVEQYLFIILFRSVRYAVPTEQGSCFLQLSSLGIGRFRHCLCLLDNVVRSHETVRAVRQFVHRCNLLHHRWDPSSTKGSYWVVHFKCRNGWKYNFFFFLSDFIGTTTQETGGQRCGRSSSRIGRPSNRRDRRRTRRSGRWHWNYSFLIEHKTLLLCDRKNYTKKKYEWK